MIWQDDLKKAVCEGDEIAADSIAASALKEGVDPKNLLEKGAVAGIYEAGRLWQAGDYFLPDMILATEAYKEAMKRIEPFLAGRQRSYKGRVLVGTVEGDAHDIGKNLVIAMMRCASYEVVDIGVDVAIREIVEKTREFKPDALGLGAYMTTTMRKMQDVILALEKSGLRSEVKVIVGGAPVTPEYAKRIGADGYGRNAAEAVEILDRILGGS
jgi:5-methyltetrahydrofolate--homocysteine methyltransferase